MAALTRERRFAAVIVVMVCASLGAASGLESELDSTQLNGLELDHSVTQMHSTTGMSQAFKEGPLEGAITNSAPASKLSLKSANKDSNAKSEVLGEALGAGAGTKKEAVAAEEATNAKEEPGNARALLGKGPTPPTTPPTPLQCRTLSGVPSDAAKVVQLTKQNFKVHSRCTKFGALPSNQTCPEGYCITPGTLVNKRVHRHGACVSVQTVLCQCGPTDCPTASCKTYTPKSEPEFGDFVGFTVDNSALYKANFTAWAHVNMGAKVERKVINTIKQWTQDFIKIRASKIAACSKSIEGGSSTTGAAGMAMTEPCYRYSTAVRRRCFEKLTTGLECCTVPYKRKGMWDSIPDWVTLGYNGEPIPGSHQWPDTPTRCTLDNPLVQSFYSNMGPMQIMGSGRIAMPGFTRGSSKRKWTQVEELAKVNKCVKSAMETAFPGEQVAINIASIIAGGKVFAIVIGAGQRNAVGRRLLGGPLNNTKLDGKQPGWYGCEIKYLAIVSLGHGRCSKNGSGDLCEPQMAASLLLWMATGPNNEQKWTRPNNNAKICARVDTALRLALTKYRLEIISSGRLKWYQNAFKLQ